MIGIKHMKMPKCCKECPFLNENYELKDYCGANAHSLRHVNTSEERHHQCPLVEIR